MEEVEIVQLKGNGKRKGPVMQKKEYKLLADSIVQCITNSDERRLDLNQLLEQVTALLGDQSKNHIPGKLLLVKNDLKEKGIIRISFDSDRNQNIILNQTQFYGM